MAPGDSETFELGLINLDSHTETFTLVPSGLLAGWVRITPPTVTLFGGSYETISVTLRPPQLASTPAGAAPLTIRIIPQDQPDDVIIAETTAVIGAFHDRRIHPLQPVVRSRRRAVLEFLVENHGNSQASCRLHLIDLSRRLDGDFDPPAVGIEPGGNSLVRLKMKAVRRQWRRGSRTLPFTVEADQQGFPTAATAATFVQTPVLPERLGRKFAGLVAVAGVLAGIWFGVLKPLTERTARDAVDDQATTIVINTAPGDTTSGAATTPTVTTVDPGTTGTTAPVTAPEPESGTGFSQRILVSAQAGQQAANGYEVPAGTELRITDVILQNVNDDGGLATVSRNDTALQQWDMSTSIANIDPLQLFSPLVFAPGDRITFLVDCDAPGGTTGVCEVGLLISGMAYPSG